MLCPKLGDSENLDDEGNESNSTGDGGGHGFSLAISQSIMAYDEPLQTVLVTLACRSKRNITWM